MSSSVTKHPRHERTTTHPSNDGIDRISQLPEAILINIISLLPTEDAVVTSALSKNWKFLWKEIHNLSFSFKRKNSSSLSEEDYDYKYNDVHSKNFASFINKILKSLKKQSIEKFSLHIDEYCDLVDFEHWIAAAISRNVKVVELVLTDAHIDVELPCSLFTCKTLEVLYLEGRSIYLGLPISVSLPNLKTLTLHKVNYQLEDRESFSVSVSELISGCSSLETLTVSRIAIDDVETFTILSPTLRNLTLDFREELFPDWDHKLEINAPQLRYLQLYDSLSEDFCFENLCSLDDARITLCGVRCYVFNDEEYCHDYSNSVVKLLQGLYNVKNLSVNGYDIEGIANASVTTSFPRLSQLTLENTCSKFLPDFLEGSQKLESVTLLKNISYDDDNTHWTCWSKPEKVPICLLSCLKTMTIVGLEGKDDEFAMVAYILKYAKVLKTMTIQPHYSLSFKARIRLFQKVSKFPRGSQECKLDFLDDFQS